MSRLLVAAVLAACWFVPIAAQITWRPGFAKCVTSVNPAGANYFAELSECPIETHGQWLVGLQSEAALAESCGGPNAQSLPINAGGPVTLAWEPYQKSWALRMRVDFYHFRHPCTDAGQYTWFSLMDHSYARGGPLPSSDRIKVHYRGIYYEAVGDQKGMSRMGITWSGVWDHRTMAVDVQLYTNAGWGDAHPDPDILWRYEAPDAIYVQMRGDRMEPLYKIVEVGAETSLVIDFAAVLTNLIARGILPPRPAGGGETAWIGPFLETYTPTWHRRSVAAEVLLYEVTAFQ